MAGGDMKTSTRDTRLAFIAVALIASFSYGIVLTVAGYTNVGALMVFVPVAIIMPRLMVAIEPPSRSKDNGGGCS
jgi:hypothetical protein